MPAHGYISPFSTGTGGPLRFACWVDTDCEDRYGDSDFIEEHGKRVCMNNATFSLVEAK